MTRYIFASPWAQSMLLPLFLQCYLLVGRQTPRNRQLRLLLAAIAIPLSLSTPFVYPLLEPRERAVALNFAGGIAGPYGAMRALEWGLATERYRWVGYAKDEKGEIPQGLARLQHAVSLMCSMRMIGWQPSSARLPAPPPRQTGKFLRVIIGRIVLFQVIGHLSAIPITEASHTPGGMEAVLSRYVKPFAHFNVAAAIFAAVCLGQACWAGLEQGHAIFAMLSWILIGVLRILPLPSALKPAPFDVRGYPPLWLRGPWLAQSMSTFWSETWHALFHAPFLAVGFRPMRALFRPFERSVAYAAGVIGVFSVSAVMHELGLLAATHHLKGHEGRADPYGRTTVFFVGCGFIVVLENAFTRLTGWKVRGILGRIWAFGLLFAIGVPMSDEWFKRGLTDNLAPVAQWSWKRWVIPLSWVLADDVLVA